jgi:hypothetical protein
MDSKFERRLFKKLRISLIRRIFGKRGLRE